MLSLLCIVAIVGLLIALGLRVCMYLYGAGALRYNAGRESGLAQASVADTEAEEAIAETEFMASMVHSLER